MMVKVWALSRADQFVQSQNMEEINLYLNRSMGSIAIMQMGKFTQMVVFARNVNFGHHLAEFWNRAADSLINSFGYSTISVDLL